VTSAVTAAEPLVRSPAQVVVRSERALGPRPRARRRRGLVRRAALCCTSRHDAALYHAVTFVAGTRIAHTLVNRGTQECLLFIVGERRPDDDRVCYPDDSEYDAAHANDAPESHWSP